MVIQIIEPEANYAGGINNASGSQYPPPVRSNRGRKLLRLWDELDRQIRCSKHIEQLLAPIYFLAATEREQELVSNDPITLFFWGLCQMDFPTLTKSNWTNPMRLRG